MLVGGHRCRARSSRPIGLMSTARRSCAGTCFLSPARLVELPDGTVTPRYKFNHVLYLEVPYRLLPPMRRSQIHRRIGHSGEVIYGPRVGEIATELAMRFEQGHDAVRAVRYLLLAAENARHRSAHHEADTLARRGLSMLSHARASDERDRQELSLTMVLGVSAMSLKGFAADEVKDIYERALTLCARAGWLAGRLLAQWLLGLFYYFRAEMRRCHEITPNGSSIAPDGWPIRCSPAKRHVHSASSSGPGQVLLSRWISATRWPWLCEAQGDGQSRAFAGQDPAVTSECYAARALWALG